MRIALKLTLCILALSAAAHGQAVVRGVSLGTTCKLTDSILGPGAPVVLTWSDTLEGWSGDGNGITYHLVYRDATFGWEVRAILPEGDFALAWSPHVKVDGSPIRWRDAVNVCGPMGRLYGSSGTVTITVTP